MANDPDFPERVRVSGVLAWAILAAVGTAGIYVGVLGTKVDRALEWESRRDAANGPAEFERYKGRTDRLESDSAAMKAQLLDMDKKLDHASEVIAGTNKMLEQLILNFQFSHPSGDHDGAAHPSR